jgi:hypothetical protein
MEYTQHSNCELVRNHVGDMDIPLNAGIPSRYVVKKNFIFFYRVGQKNLAPECSKILVLELILNIKSDPHKDCKT